jgi:hypothetical protein
MLYELNTYKQDFSMQNKIIKLQSGVEIIGEIIPRCIECFAQPQPLRMNERRLRERTSVLNRGYYRILWPQNQ